MAPWSLNNGSKTKTSLLRRFEDWFGRSLWWRRWRWGWLWRWRVIHSIAALEDTKATILLTILCCFWFISKDTLIALFVLVWRLNLLECGLLFFLFCLLTPLGPLEGDGLLRLLGLPAEGLLLPAGLFTDFLIFFCRVSFLFVVLIVVVSKTWNRERRKRWFVQNMSLDPGLYGRIIHFTVAGHIKVYYVSSQTFHQM